MFEIALRTRTDGVYFTSYYYISASIETILLDAAAYHSVIAIVIYIYLFQSITIHCQASDKQMYNTYTAM